MLGIKTDIDARFPVNTGIQPSDVCTALGNLLDNAIEGSRDTDNARITGATPSNPHIASEEQYDCYT